MKKMNNSGKNQSRVTNVSIKNNKLAAQVAAFTPLPLPAEIRLANAFIEELVKVIRPNEFIQINTLNRFYGDDSCATHEFCDANECLAIAFTKAFGMEFMVNNQSHLNVANKAWKLAKKHNFNKIRK